MITIEIPIEPRGQGRPRAYIRGQHASVYKADNDRQYEATLRQYFKDAVPKPIQGPVEVYVVAHFTMPKSKHRKRNPRLGGPHAKKPDADNVLKGVKDAGKGVLWLDDSQVWYATVIKWEADQGQPGCLLVRIIETRDAIARIEI